MIKRLISGINNKVRKMKLKLSWYLLKFSFNPQVRKLVKCFSFIQDKKTWRKGESSCFNVINEIRQGYSNSNKTIVVKDYGAGNPNSYRTVSEMENGVEVEKLISDIYKVAASPVEWGELIFKIVREMKPQKVLELGTSLGISAAYQVSALKLNGNGRFISIEGSHEIAKMATLTLEKLEFENFCVQTGKFKNVIPEILDGEGNIDMIFIDGHHDKGATLEYFEMLYPHLAENSILIFDDINWSAGMKQVWKEIYSDKRINVSFDLNKWGICQINKRDTRNKLKHFMISM